MSADQLVLDLVRKHDRPFNTQMVADLLATKGVKKAQAQRSLDALATGNQIRFKEFGKNKIYFPVHDGPNLTKDELIKKQNDVATLQAAVSEKQDAVKQSKQELSVIRDAPSNTELREQIASVRKQSEVLEQRVSCLEDGKITISASDYEAVQKLLEKYVDAWQKRKRIFNDVCGLHLPIIPKVPTAVCRSSVSEGVTMKQKDVFDDAGVDTDEQMKLVLRDFRNLVSKRSR